MLKNKIFALSLIVLLPLTVAFFGSEVTYRCEEFECIENYTGSCCTVHNFGLVEDISFDEENVTRVLGKRDEFIIANIDRIRIDQLVFINSSADFLPRQIFTMNPRIRVLNITNGSISSIRRHEFEGAVKLNFLLLPNNRLTQLRSNSFEGADHLYHVDLSRNLIESIDEAAFAGLSFLSNLDLSHNQLTTIEVKTFASSGRLFSLNLAHNRIKELDPFTFYYCTKLDRLNLNFNRLVHLTIMTPFNELRSLKVENNQIWNLTVMADEIKQPRWMLKIHAAENLLWNLTTNFNVREFDLYANNFINISFLTQQSSSLQVLNLGKNPLLKIDYQVINQLEKLKFLNLTNLMIGDLQNDHIDLPHLESLDLSHNRLKSVNNLVKFNKLKFLSLEDNPVVQTSDLTTLRRIGFMVQCIKVHREWDCVEDELRDQEYKFEQKYLWIAGVTFIGALILMIAFTIIKTMMEKSRGRVNEAPSTNTNSVATELEVF